MEEKNVEEKENVEEKKESAVPPPPLPPPYPYYPPPPLPPEEELSPAERVKLGVLRAITIITLTICVISLIAAIAGFIFFNIGVDSSASFRDLDVLRGIVLMIFSAFLLLATYIFIIASMKKLDLGG